MNTWTSDWIPLFVLPNLLVKEPVEVEFVALVSPDDPRCLKIGKANPNFTKFLHSFTDAFKRKVGRFGLRRDVAESAIRRMAATFFLARAYLAKSCPISIS
jgi:hypothetical protein